MARHIDIRAPGAYQAEQEAKDQKAWLRVNGPGPKTAECDECGAFAPFARGDFGKPTDQVERFCEKHCPDSLKRPGDFIEAPQL